MLSILKYEIEVRIGENCSMLSILKYEIEVRIDENRSPLLTLKCEIEVGIGENCSMLLILKYEMEVRIGEKRLMVQPLEKVDGNTSKLARLQTVFHHARALVRSRTFARRDAKPRLEQRHQSYHHADVTSLRNLNAISNRLSVNSITSVCRCNGLLPEFIVQ